MLTSCVALYQTHSLIEQQKSEEYNRLRAYVYFENIHLINSFNDDGTSVKSLDVKLKNSGQTPAFDVTLSLKIDNKEFDPSNGNYEVNIFPGETEIIKNQYYGIKVGTHSVVLKFRYKTYNGSCSLGEIIGTFSDVETNSNFVFTSQNDNLTNCLD